MYDKAFLEQAMEVAFFRGATVQQAREEGMPGSSGADPRKAQDPHVLLIDVRRAWDECEWLTREQRQAILAWAMTGTRALASMVTGVPEGALDYRREVGLQAMADWMNSTYEDREYWAEL